MVFLSYFSISISNYIQYDYHLSTHAYDYNLSLPFIHSYDSASPKTGPTNESTLVQKENMKTSFKDLPARDEALENYVHPRLIKFPSPIRII